LDISTPMIFQRPKGFVLLTIITFAMPFLTAFFIGRGILQASLMFGLWGCLFVASFFQVRRNRSLANLGFTVWFLTFIVIIMLPHFISDRHTVGK
jgi:hypothetical protein